MFTDPSCGYCRALHAEIPKLNEMGITVKYALYARNGNGTLTGRQLTEVLCSNDPKAELTKFFAASTKDVKGAECRKADGLERIARIAPQVGLKGTPHIVTDKGLAFSGYQPAQELLQAAADRAVIVDDQDAGHGPPARGIQGDTIQAACRRPSGRDPVRAWR